jgi:hypothetical protein
MAATVTRETLQVTVASGSFPVTPLDLGLGHAMLRPDSPGARLDPDVRERPETAITAFMAPPADQPDAAPHRLGGGRRRGALLTSAIYQATLDELAETGFGRLSFDKIAASAGTGKAALYRRWATPAELVLEALADPSSGFGDIPVPGTGSLRGDLVFLLGGFARVMEREPRGRALLPLITQRQRHPELYVSLRRYRPAGPEGRSIRRRTGGRFSPAGPGGCGGFSSLPGLVPARPAEWTPWSLGSGSSGSIPRNSVVIKVLMTLPSFLAIGFSLRLASVVPASLRKPGSRPAMRATYPTAAARRGGTR